eukprot:CAMPEP_0119377086 /NCGR_PEP_ID=MMETSP1334-20130426/43133_1 /TAXON_ID=127549 /ORGANISM="Calcidiscus leptoporus, Strain RCC1130" /LENGTH=181 /DNA_ID=CAMNT_0007395877 /DNA_START=253 /DNA_END=796 /DNA_ORIENTATION=+
MKLHTHSAACPTSSAAPRRGAAPSAAPEASSPTALETSHASDGCKTATGDQIQPRECAALGSGHDVVDGRGRAAAVLTEVAVASQDVITAERWCVPSYCERHTPKLRQNNHRGEAHARFLRAKLHVALLHPVRSLLETEKHPSMGLQSESGEKSALSTKVRMRRIVWVELGEWPATVVLLT